MVGTRGQILGLKCTKFDFGWGSISDPDGELTALPQIPFPSWIQGPTSKRGRGGKVKRGEAEVRGGVGGKWGMRVRGG